MPDLIAKPALGHAPLCLAETTLAEAEGTPIHSIAPYPGGMPALDAALAPLNLRFPAANRYTESGTARLAWAGRDMAFLLGAVPPDGLPAAVTDQSDGWVTLTLTGPQARATLARLVPFDLRHAATGQCFRSALNHLPLVLMVDAPDRFRLMTFRSMARTAWHEVHEALEKVAARAQLGL